MKVINGFDCDGVITVGLYPGPDDIIITGRSVEEQEETLDMLKKKNIDNSVWFNPCRFDNKTREQSGWFKVCTIRRFLHVGIKVQNFFEDDPIQADIIEKNCFWVNVVRVVHDLTEKENVRHIGDY